ncbi:THAP domain-containing protein 2 [Aphis craccivora]|uniref:THAP domain-containing protein 2 n=1 Tax=Aphis craccivora TaxID=307492 RepID=A0A6G0YYB9_APHCR|nr:THAP domain-containing protein 2 [Aphis craccivora]
MPNICILCPKPTLKNPSSAVSFHLFPRCPKKRQLWIKRCKLTNKEVLPHHKICSLHFEPTCFKSNLKRRILYPDAVPTVFGKGHIKKTDVPFKTLKEKSKNHNKSNNCILCVKSVLKYYPSFKISLHLFPACPIRRQVWINHCKLTNQKVLPNHKICSLHFEPTCFKSTEKRRILYPNAIPTIFEKGLVTKKKLPKRIVKGKLKDCDKIDLARQNQQSPNMLVTKATKTGNFGSKRESHDLSRIKVDKEVFGPMKSIATSRKRKFDELNGTVTKLRSNKLFFMSLLNLVRIQISLGNKIK